MYIYIIVVTGSWRKGKQYDACWKIQDELLETKEYRDIIDYYWEHQGLGYKQKAAMCLNKDIYVRLNAIEKYKELIEKHKQDNKEDAS